MNGYQGNAGQKRHIATVSQELHWNIKMPTPFSEETVGPKENNDSLKYSKHSVVFSYLSYPISINAVDEWVMKRE